jgi:cell division protein FtsW
MMSKEARLLFIVTYLLVGLGIIMIYSASGVLAHDRHGNEMFFLIRQGFYVLLGTIGFFIAATLPIDFYKKNARAFMLLAIMLLMTVYLPVIGHSAGGARRWIHLGGFQFQPVEFAKLACCIYLADYIGRKIAIVQKGDIRVFVPPLILIGVVCVLTLLEPDLGSVAFIVMMTSIVLFVSGIQLRYVFGALALLLPALYFLIIRVPYRLSRLEAYLNPWEDPQGSGFQIIQSFLAFASGGVRGVGLGQSTQKLFYLPSSHNDFILAVIGEELGLIGIMFVIALYVVFFVCCIRMARRTEQPFEKLLITSITLLIVLQTVIHMMVATGLVPTKGLPLPFISYGGSSIVSNLVAVGILVAVDRRKRRST